MQNIPRWKKSDRGSSHFRHGLDPRLIHDKFFHCSTTRMDADTRLHNSKWLIRVNQSPHLTKDRFA